MYHVFTWHNTFVCYVNSPVISPVYITATYRASTVTERDVLHHILCLSVCKHPRGLLFLSVTGRMRGKSNTVYTNISTPYEVWHTSLLSYLTNMHAVSFLNKFESTISFICVSKHISLTYVCWVEQGINGQQGITDQQSINGQQGVNGQQGINGQQGVNGQKGVNYQQGVNVQQSINVQQGVNGQQSVVNDQ